MNNILRGDQLIKTFEDGAGRIEVLRGVDLQVNAGEMIAIVGASGSGKSTLLHLLGGLDKPTAGKIIVNHQDITDLSERARCQLRNRYFGFVYQFHHLLPEFTALENVCMPLLIRGTSPANALTDAKKLLIQVGLENRLHHKPAELSGGERQRVAIARAVVAKPHCVFADEPTGNLDPRTAETVFHILLECQRAFKTSIVMVTHDLVLAKRADRIYLLQAGILCRVD